MKLNFKNFQTSKTHKIPTSTVETQNLKKACDFLKQNKLYGSIEDYGSGDRFILKSLDDKNAKIRNMNAPYYSTIPSSKNIIQDVKEWFYRNSNSKIEIESKNGHDEVKIPSFSELFS